MDIISPFAGFCPCSLSYNRKAGESLFDAAAMLAQRCGNFTSTDTADMGARHSIFLQNPVLAPLRYRLAPGRVKPSGGVPIVRC